MSNARVDWVNHETPDLSSAPFIAVKFLLGLRLGFILAALSKMLSQSFVLYVAAAAMRILLHLFHMFVHANAFTRIHNLRRLAGNQLQT